MVVLFSTAWFQSTRPVRDATSTGVPSVSVQVFQSTRPVRDATPMGLLLLLLPGVSIHASRAGRDNNPVWKRSGDTVSIHASRAGRDSFVATKGISIPPFQSTRPVRDATRTRHAFRSIATFQSTRPVRDATVLGSQWFRRKKVSIHASRAGRDANRLAAA